MLGVSVTCKAISTNSTQDTPRSFLSITRLHKSKMKRVNIIKIWGGDACISLKVRAIAYYTAGHIQVYPLGQFKAPGSSI